MTGMTRFSTSEFTTTANAAPITNATASSIRSLLHQEVLELVNIDDICSSSMGRAGRAAERNDSLTRARYGSSRCASSSAPRARARVRCSRLRRGRARTYGVAQRGSLKVVSGVLLTPTGGEMKGASGSTRSRTASSGARCASRSRSTSSLPPARRPGSRASGRARRQLRRGRFELRLRPAPKPLGLGCATAAGSPAAMP